MSKLNEFVEICAAMASLHSISSRWAEMQDEPRLAQAWFALEERALEIMQDCHPDDIRQSAAFLNARSSRLVHALPVVPRNGVRSASKGFRPNELTACLEWMAAEDLEALFNRGYALGEHLQTLINHRPDDPAWTRAFLAGLHTPMMWGELAKLDLSAIEDLDRLAVTLRVVATEHPTVLVALFTTGFPSPWNTMETSWKLGVALVLAGGKLGMTIDEASQLGHEEARAVAELTTSHHGLLELERNYGDLQTVLRRQREEWVAPEAKSKTKGRRKV